MREEEVRHQDRHGPPEMCVRRHHRIAGRCCLFRERVDYQCQLPLQQRDPTPQIQAQIDRHLLVTRTACVKTLAKVASPLHQLPLDERVHVFIVTVDERRILPASLEDLAKSGRHHFCLRLAEDANPCKSFHPREAAGHVVFEESLVESERRPEVKRGRIGFAAETSGPQVSHRLFRHRRVPPRPFRGCFDRKAPDLDEALGR